MASSGRPMMHEHIRAEASNRGGGESEWLSRVSALKQFALVRRRAVSGYNTCSCSGERCRVTVPYAFGKDKR
ncbi:hypothetical protein J6590_102887 [Homalodisca vitripennis]|nr:hypothetical protein J6590_102887 [Homalodisca vitripennis]